MTLLCDIEITSVWGKIYCCNYNIVLLFCQVKSTEKASEKSGVYFADADEGDCI
jgi:hypothetical protein